MTDNDFRKRQVYAFLGKTVTVTVDRPVGSPHPKHPDIIYPVKYGYIAGEIAPDGEELDVYIIGVKEPLSCYTGRVIAIVHRKNDVEDKLVAAPEGVLLSEAKIAEMVRFQEQFYESWVELMDGRRAAK